MTQRLTEGDTLDQLQTPEQVALLDTIDELRSQGLGHHGINLPQLIVCGDQSSGKSSLLEGLTRLRFPVKDNLGTTFATEVVLRRATSTRITCTITPCEKRTQADCRALSEFEHTFLSRDEFKFESVVDEAKELMANGVEDKRTSIFKDVLRIKYTGPSLPSLTVVDLPGMIEQDLGGSDADERIVELVTTYMRNKESIILAVVQAGNDPENQKVFKHLKKYDEKRLRTLGIITKPDRVYQGSESEKKLIALAKNEIYPLTHGWHAVRNRDHTTKDQSDIERDATEQQFFADGLWSSLPRKHVGIEALRAKLSRILLEHVSMGLDSIISAVHGAITTTESTLKSMGRARETTKEQRAYLTARAERFQMLTNDALRGIYSNTFFALLSPTERTPTRLRTTIQNLNIAFAHAMYRKGHTWDIISGQVPASGFTKVLGTSSSGTQEYETRFEDPMCISRTDFLENHIGAYVKQSRSSGLPSLVNPWVIGAVFRQQSENWCDIAKHHLQQVSRAVRDYIEEALGSLIDSRTHKLLMLKHIQPELEGRWRKVEAKLEELLVPYTEQDPITYDPGFIRDLEAMRTSRYKPNTDLQTQGIQFFGHAKSATVSSVTSQRLLTESLDDFTNSEILDLMQTYYKVGIFPGFACFKTSF
jgi:GTPase SAR1 family protein